MDESLRDVLKSFELPYRSPEYIQKWILVVLVFIALLALLYFLGSVMVKGRERYKIRRASDRQDLTREERALILRASRGRNKINPDLALGSIGEFHRLFGPLMHELISRALHDNEAKKMLDRIFVLRKRLFGDIAYHFGSLTSTIQLRLGQSLTLQFSHQERSYTLNVVVVDVDGAAITVTSPRDGGEFFRFDRGHPFKVSFYREGDGYYQFDSHALRSSKEEKQQFLLLSHALQIERVQSREFYREATSIAFSYRRYAWDQRPETRYEVSDGELEQSREGIIQNIGGGGIQFTARDNLERNDLIAFDLPLNPEAVIPDLLGKVVRVEKIPEDPEQVRVNLQFLNIKPAEQDLIVRMIQQRRIEKSAEQAE